jgi:protein-S-isoprenylcysteine O-methyltransferase Ste14
MPEPPRTPRSVYVLTAVVAVGVCAMAAAVMVPALLGGLGAWPLIVAGVLLLIVGLGALWVIQRRRDRSLW